MNGTYFFDSYAFFEILRGNPQYEQYKNNVTMITTKLNLLELHYWLLIQKSSEVADYYYFFFEKNTLEFGSETIKEASRFRARHRKQKLSYIDCIGYVMAKSKNAKFLTGDKQFEGMENVEFVK